MSTMARWCSAKLYGTFAEPYEELIGSGKDGRACRLTQEVICIAERAKQGELVKLSDSDEFRLEDKSQDVRGLDVYGG